MAEMIVANPYAAVDIAFMAGVVFGAVLVEIQDFAMRTRDRKRRDKEDDR